MKNIDQKEWRGLLANDNNAVIIDCRTPMEWRDGIIENSLLININNPQSFINSVNTLDVKKNYYVYCRSGNKSIQACQVLESIGIETTYNLLGGIIAWTAKLIDPLLK